MFVPGAMHRDRAVLTIDENVAIDFIVVAFRGPSAPVKVYGAVVFDFFAWVDASNC